MKVFVFQRVQCFGQLVLGSLLVAVQKQVQLLVQLAQLVLDQGEGQAYGVKSGIKGPVSWTTKSGLMCSANKKGSKSHCSA